MKLSTRARYGARALLDIALHEQGKPILLRDVAQREQISLPYLEHLITPLVAAGMVRSTRGARGGIQLAKPPQDIKLGEVVELLEGSIDLVECIDNPGYCSRSNACVTREVWGELREAMNRVLESITLNDLMERQRRKDLPAH